MDLPYNVSDFAFPSRWDSDSSPSVVERAGRPEIDQRTRVQADCDKGSNSGALSAFVQTKRYAMPYLLPA